MATKKTNKKVATKSNVSKSSKKQSFRFRWWMAVIGIGIVALVGIAVVRFSRASGPVYDGVIAANNDTRMTVYVQGKPYSGSISVFSRGWNQGWETTEYRFVLDGGIVACGNIQTTNFKNINDTQPGQTVKWIVSNPSCTKG